jgi:HPt (histidine-containing phosphotransfer) domain-containing protein
MDMETALKFVGGHKEILHEVIHVFLEEDFPQQIKKLKDGIPARDTDAVKQSAHSIKGAVRSLGGKAAGDTALKLEEMGRNKNLTGAEKALQQLEQEITLFKEYYSKYNWEKTGG